MLLGNTQCQALQTLKVKKALAEYLVASMGGHCAQGWCDQHLIKSTLPSLKQVIVLDGEELAPHVKEAFYRACERCLASQTYSWTLSEGLRSELSIQWRS